MTNPSPIIPAIKLFCKESAPKIASTLRSLSNSIGNGSLPDSNKSESMRQFGNVMGTACLAGGLFLASRILRIGPKGLKWIPKTDEGKQFENIKNIQDKNEKEKLAYESLVALASTSRNKKNEKDDQNIQIQMTIEEKTLDNYLNQRAVPVNIYGW